MELVERLTILMESGQISKQTINRLLEVLSYLKYQKNIELTEDNGSMFITHLAIALERIKKSESLPAMDSEMLSQLMDDCNYNEAELLFNDIQAIVTTSISPEEKTYIMLHLCILLKNKEVKI